MNLNQFTLPAIDVGQWVAFYKALGLRLIIHAIPGYARFECVEGNAAVSAYHVEAMSSDSGVVIYFECEDWPSAMHAAVIAFVVTYLKCWNRNEGLPWMRANASVTVSASCM